MNFVKQYEGYTKEFREAIAKAYRHWNCEELIDVTKLQWNNRFRRRAADAQLLRMPDLSPKGNIRMSTLIWPHLSDFERYEIAVHEAAHVAAPYLIKRSPDTHIMRDGPLPHIGHGYEWKKLMLNIGLKPKRCHSVDTYAKGISKRRDRFHYKCKCRGGCPIGPICHVKIQDMNMKYQCLTCKVIIDKSLSFTQEAGT